MTTAAPWPDEAPRQKKKPTGGEVSNPVGRVLLSSRGVALLGFKGSKAGLRNPCPPCSRQRSRLFAQRTTLAPVLPCPRTYSFQGRHAKSPVSTDQSGP